MLLTKKIEQRYWNNAKVDTSCWSWAGPKLPTGYGLIRASGHTFYAHRISWMLHSRQEIPEGMYISHHCDNPECTNPIHLFLATPSDNTRDMYSKGRGPKSILVPADIIKIRALYDTGEYTQEDIAEQFSVNYRTINDIIHERAWAWVT